jgi:hypothetical protein
MRNCEVVNLLVSDVFTYHTRLHILKLGLRNFFERSFMLSHLSTRFHRAESLNTLGNTLIATV